MEHAHSHQAYLCDGSRWPGTGGSYVGHLLPGLVLCAWALHWFVSATVGRLTGRRLQPRGAAHHGCVGASGLLQHLEAVLKVVFPAVAILLEFQLSGTRRLRCPAGSAEAGELDVAHLNSWSHATNYPPLMLSGAVDLAHSLWAPRVLPLGVPHFFLASAFGTSAFLMLSHGKGDPLDGLLHQLLGWCMAAVAGAVAAQGAVEAQGPRGGGSYGLSAAKSLALLMQGCWFFAITHISFSDDATWRASRGGDTTRLMFVPVLFAWVFLGLLVVMLLAYMGMHAALSCLGRLADQQRALEQAASSAGDSSGKAGPGACSSGRLCGHANRSRYARLHEQGEGDGRMRQHRPQPSDDASSTDTAIELV